MKLIVIALLPALFLLCSCEKTKLSVINIKEHFIFYCQAQDEPVIDDLSAILETNYTNVLIKLKYPNNFHTKVYVYPDLKSFHKRFGQNNAPDWWIGRASRGSIYIVSPRNPGPMHSYYTVIKAIVHEFVHIVTDKKNSNCRVKYNSKYYLGGRV